MRYLKWIVLVFWYVLYMEVALSYYQGIDSKTWGQPIPSARAILGLVLITASFALAHLALRTVAQHGQSVQATPAPPTFPLAYPSEVTVKIGVMLLAITGFLILGLFFILNSMCWPDWLMKCLEKSADFTNAAATMFGAGIGSAVATMLAYLEHASEKKDFEVAYAPWYIARPLMGMLLGLIFYFLLQDGLLAVVVHESSSANLSEVGLAGVGALVGLFSKEAIEKLRELFNTLFSTQKSLEESLLKRMPPELKDKVRPYLASGKADGENTNTPNPTPNQ